MFIALPVHAAESAKAPDSLADDFRTPPDSARPWVYLWWFNTWVDKPGITHHLEELKDKGFGGVILYNSSDSTIPKGPKFLSPEWRDLFLYTEKECARLGLLISLNVCDGWPSGGPWVPIESSSWSHTESTTLLTGPQSFDGRLAAPPNFGPHYRDVAIWAYPVPAPEVTENLPRVTASSNPAALPHLTGIADYSTFWSSAPRPLPVSPASPEWVQFEYPAPKQVDTVWVGGNAFNAPSETVVQASDDGVAFRNIGRLASDPMDSTVGPVTPATARIYRFVFIHGKNQIFIHTLQLGTRAEVGRTALLAAKACRTSLKSPTNSLVADQTSFPWQPLAPAPGDTPLPLKGSIDLTGITGPDGTLKWNVPPGRWKIVRIGANPNGIGVGGGYLTDYLSARTMDLQCAALAPLIQDAGPLAGKTFVRFYEDNPEIPGLYSWTPLLLDEFQRRRGYDARPWLPALCGEIIENTNVTNRFLYDYRRTVADCIADNHYGEWVTQSHAAGLGVQAEAGGQYLPQMHPVDGLMNLGRMDIPGGEFWLSSYWKENQTMTPHVWSDGNQQPDRWNEEAQNINAKEVSSAAHIYGKPIAAAEAFTTLGPLTHWATGPGDLLLDANIAFCEGINRFTLHSSTVNKSTDGIPGFEYAAGCHFDPRVTWWPFSRPFFTFLSRCEAMLQRGLSVADVLYYNGGDIPNFVPPKHVDPSLGPGYDYDVCNTEVLLNRLSVKDGRIVLPDGMSYNALALPATRAMPLAALRKIVDLVRAGASVVGPRPLHTLSLKDYANEETAFNHLASDVWGASDGIAVTSHAYGAGHVYWGRSLRDVLAALAVPPDFIYTSPDPIALFDFVHRRDSLTDIYFVANRRGRAETCSATFRVEGKQPEIWDPFTGRIRDASAFTQRDGRTTVPLALDPYGSCFVIFRKEISSHQGSGDENFPRFLPVATIEGPWQVKFDPAWGGPASITFDRLVNWAARPESGIRYYSGTAVYSKDFEIPSNAEPVFLNLGDVRNVASVRINDQDAGIAWHTPYRLDISKWVRTGTNHLEIKVANLWPNRLIGDARLPLSHRLGKTNILFSPTHPLLPSGLIGPVRLEKASRKPGSPVF